MVTTAALMALMVAGPAAAQEPLAKTKSVTATATVTAIDTTARLITLRDEKGQEDTYRVSPDLKRFNEFKVGDTIRMSYHEAVVVEVLKPGQKSSAGSVKSAEKGKSGLPEGKLSAQDTVNVTVKAIDPAVPSVTVATADGRTFTRKVQNKKNIEGLKVGDQVDITYSRALVVSLDRAK
jgi:hypothetical protein